MRSYDGESSSTDDDDRREGLPEVHLQQGSWQRTASHPTWAWEHRNAVSVGGGEPLAQRSSPYVYLLDKVASSSERSEICKGEGELQLQRLFCDNDDAIV